MESQDNLTPPNFWGPADKPAGDSGLPPADIFDPALDQYIYKGPEKPAITYTDPVLSLDLSDTALMRFSADERDIIRSWYPQIFGQPSSYLNGLHVLTAEQLLIHGKEYQRANWNQVQSETAAARKSERGQLWLEWQDQCQQRKAWIEAKHREVKKRKQQKIDALRDSTAQWDAYIAAAEGEYREAKATPAPPRPA